MRALIAPAAALAASAGTAAAHPLAAALHRSVHWTWQPWVLASLVLAALWYAAGVVRLHRRLGPTPRCPSRSIWAARGPRKKRRLLGAGEITAFAAGLGTIFIALESPIDSISDQLFCVHMVQHLLLMLVAAPLLVLGRPALAFLWAFAPGGRKRIGRLWTALALPAGVRTLMHPVVVWLLFYCNFILWHLPGPYQAALRNEAIHAAEHLSFLVTALMFWSIVIEPSGRRRLGYGATFLFVAKTAVLSALPGALLALAHRPLYPFYADGVAAWGLTQLEDQQLAGIVMWIPGGFIWVMTAALVFVKWLHEAEHRTRALALTRRAVLPVLALILLPGLLGGCGRGDPPGGAASSGGDRARGAATIRAYGCGACHTIPGVLNANGLVGPPLTQMGRRIYIAGLLRNTPGNMIAWIRNPQRFVPGVVMPDMDVTAKDARDITAYLESLR